MKAPARNHRKVRRLCRGIESGQLRAQLLVMLGLDASFGASAIKALKPAVTECLDHAILYPDRIQDAINVAFRLSGSEQGLSASFTIYRPHAQVLEETELLLRHNFDLSPPSETF
jgi:hypothetical protein